MKMNSITATSYFSPQRRSNKSHNICLDSISSSKIYNIGLTQASVAGELLVDLLHAFDVESAGLGVVDHGLGVVNPDDALGRLLHSLWGVPGVVDVLGWKPSQDGQITPENTRGSRER